MKQLTAWFFRKRENGNKKHIQIKCVRNWMYSLFEVTLANCGNYANHFVSSFSNEVRIARRAYFAFWFE